MRKDWREAAARRGEEAAGWLFDGNTTDSTLRTVLRGIEEGEPETFDAFGPTPCISGEWAGESIPELFGLAVGEEWPCDAVLEEYEQEYLDAYWHAVESECRARLAL